MSFTVLPSDSSATASVSTSYTSPRIFTVCYSKKNLICNYWRLFCPSIFPLIICAIFFFDILLSRALFFSFLRFRLSHQFMTVILLLLFQYFPSLSKAFFFASFSTFISTVNEKRRRRLWTPKICCNCLSRRLSCCLSCCLPAVCPLVCVLDFFNPCVYLSACRSVCLSVWDRHCLSICLFVGRLFRLF